MSKQRILKKFWVICAIEGGLIFLWGVSHLASQASRGGVSSSSVVLLLIFLFIDGFIGFLAFKPQNLFEAWTNKLEHLVKNNLIYYGSVLAGMIGTILSIYLVMITFDSVGFYIHGWLDKMILLLLWSILLFPQMLLVLIFFRFEKPFEGVEDLCRTLKPWAWVLGIFLLSLIILKSTGIGFDADVLEQLWGGPGAPLLPFQVTTSLIIAFGGYFLFTNFSKYISNSGLDLLICIVIWLGAFLIWNARPLGHTHFSTLPTPPNNEYYPFSDALFHDEPAYNLLIGDGLVKDVRRPLLSIFYAAIHYVFGNRYQDVVTGQILVLALLPIVFYWMGKTLHHRISGILLALLVILREKNGIALSGVIDVSHVKLLLSDVPTMLGMSAVTLFLILWLKNESKTMHILTIGGILGLFMLIRVQSLIVIGGILLLSFYEYRKKKITWLKQITLMGTVLLLTVSPWLYRNWRSTGEITFSDATQNTQLGLLNFRYRPDIEVNSRYDYDDTIDRITELASDAQYTQEALAGVLNFIRDYPGEVGKFIASHFVHNYLDSFLALPSYYPLVTNSATALEETVRGASNPLNPWLRCCTLEKYMAPLPYWDFWQGEVPAISAIPILINLALVSLGLVTAYKRLGVISLAPLFISASYIFGLAIFRVSGWRFVQPVDWVALLYYAMGLAHIVFWTISLFTGKLILIEIWDQKEPKESSFVWPKAVMMVSVFILISASIPMAESWIQPKYTEFNISEWQNFPEGVNLEDFLSQENAIALHGLGLYPKYYPANKGTFITGWPKGVPNDLNRLGFNMVTAGDDPYIMLPMDIPPDYFPNATEVVVLGCQKDQYVEAKLVYLPKNGINYWSSSTSLNCTP